MKKKRLLPPAYLLLSIAAMLALHLLAPICRTASWAFRLGGLAPLAAGLALNYWADRIFKRARTTVKPFATSAELVTHGPFRFSRHPMYLGMVLVLVGTAMLLGSLSPLAAVGAFVWVIRRFALVEEQMMAETFGQAYAAYRGRVRRWI